MTVLAKYSSEYLMRPPYQLLISLGDIVATSFISIGNIAAKGDNVRPGLQPSGAFLDSQA